MWVGLKQGVSNPARPGHALNTMTSRRIRRPLVALLFPALFVFQGACTSYSDYRFSPGVQDIEIRNPSESVLARVLIAPRGIHEHEHGDTTRLEMQFRLRIENHGPAEFVLVPEEFELVDANLESFGPAEVLPEDPEEAGGDGFFRVHFAFPAGKGPTTMDLRALRLRLGLLHGDEVLTPTAAFDRDYTYFNAYYYPDMRWSIGIGYGAYY